MEVSFSIPAINMEQARDLYPVAVAALSALAALSLIVGGRSGFGRGLAGLALIAIFVVSLPAVIDVFGIEYAGAESQVLVWAADVRSALPV